MDGKTPRVLKAGARSEPSTTVGDGQTDRDAKLRKKISEAHTLSGRLEKIFVEIKELMPTPTA